MTSTLDKVVDRVLFDLNPRYDFSVVEYNYKGIITKGFIQCHHSLEPVYALLKSYARGGTLGAALGGAYGVLTGENPTYWAAKGAALLGSLDGAINAGRIIFLEMAQIFGIEKYTPVKYENVQEVQLTSFD